MNQNYTGDTVYDTYDAVHPIKPSGNPNYGPMLDPLDYNAECRSVALELNDFATIRFNYRGGSLEWLCSHEEAQAFRPGEFYTFKFEKVTK